MTRFKQQKKKENGPGCLLIGAHMEAGEAASIKRIAEGVNRVLSESLKNGPLLLLETCAGQGSTLGHTFEQLVGTDGDVLDILTCDNLDGKKKENDYSSSPLPFCLFSFGSHKKNKRDVAIN